jgi:two-component system KDP operon response regulator KdpE
VSGLRILLIEDEPQMRRFLRGALPTPAYDLQEAATGAAGVEMAARRAPDVVLLDLGLPDMDGLEVTRRIREWSKVPIIVLSARGQETDKVGALDAGADDYLTKPFSTSELLARIRVAQRHVAMRGEDAPAVFEVDDLSVDRANRIVMVGGQTVRLTPIEYKLLVALVGHAGRAVTYQQLLKEVWGPRFATQKQYLHVYMGHLRAKLEKNPAHPRWLVTEPGVGYRLKIE